MDDELYSPSSDFLIWVLNDEVPLVGSEFADANLRRVIVLTMDEDASNRDWATFILGNLDSISPEIVDALTVCAADANEHVRAEAILGLARKSPEVALPFLQKALAADAATVPVFEAAAILAHPTLVLPLQSFDEHKGEDWVGDIIAAALKACQLGVPDEHYL